MRKVIAKILGPNWKVVWLYNYLDYKWKKRLAKKRKPDEKWIAYYYGRGIGSCILNDDGTTGGDSTYVTEWRDA